MDTFKNYIKLMRPHHYIKNFLIFIPLIFSKNIFNIELLSKVLIGFIAFSLLASMVYVINDIMDVEADRKHEKKKFRPIASGKISIKNACILVFVLFVLSLCLNIYAKANIITWIIFYTYFVINILYSIKLKHIPIIDIVILAFGFLLRVLYGATIANIEVSNWLYLTILSVSFYMGLGKRRGEFVKLGSKGRKVLKYYNKSFLDSNMYMFLTLTIVFYSLWCLDFNSAINSYFNIIWTVPFLIVICMKYSLDIEGDSLGDPVDVVLSDKILLVLGIIYTAIMFLTIYF